MSAHDSMSKTQFGAVSLDQLVTSDRSMREVLGSGRTSKTPGPIHVFPRDDMPGFEISDGHHRVADAIRAGKTEIDAEIEPGPDDEQYEPPY
jgi:ParB-like chromosome segregation protein Spo0J